MYTKQFNIESAIKWTTQLGHDRELFGIASAVVDCVVLVERVFLKAISPSRLFVETKFGWKIHKLLPCMHDCSFEIIHRFSLCKPLDSSTVFCSYSLMHTATTIWAIWTTDHAILVSHSLF